MEKFDSKAITMWKVSKEQEEEFRNSLPEDYDKGELDELFKLIRGVEYRRGKEDALIKLTQNLKGGKDKNAK